MLFTGLGWSVLGETVPSVWELPSAYGLVRYSRPRAQFLPVRTLQPVNEDLRSHPSGFYKTFKPFLSDTEVHEPKWEKHHYQKHGEILKKDQQKK